MKRLLLVALCLVCGCKKDASSESPQAIDQQAALKPLPPLPPPEKVDAGAVAEDEDVDERRDDEDDLLPKPKEEEKARKITPKSELKHVTEEDLQKFIVWRKKTQELLVVAQKEFQARSNAIRKAGGLQQQIELNRAVQEFAAKKLETDKQAQAASGLDPKEAEWMRAFVWDVMGNRLLAEQSGLDQTVKQAQDSMKNMNPEQRADAQADLDKLKATLANLVSLRDPRDEYGDQNVDLVLKHEAELMPLYKESVGAK